MSPILSQQVVEEYRVQLHCGVIKRGPAHRPLPSYPAAYPVFPMSFILPSSSSVSIHVLRHLLATRAIT
jgi:hypothetical protein